MSIETESKEIEEDRLEQEEATPASYRKEFISFNDDDTKASEDRGKSPLSSEQKEQFIRLIEHELRDNKAFLDEHYNLMKLSRAIGKERTYTSFACTELGGFLLHR